MRLSNDPLHLSRSKCEEVLQLIPLCRDPAFGFQGSL